MRRQKHINPMLFPYRHFIISLLCVYSMLSSLKKWLPGEADNDFSVLFSFLTFGSQEINLTLFSLSWDCVVFRESQV